MANTATVVKKRKEKNKKNKKLGKMTAEQQEEAQSPAEIVEEETDEEASEEDSPVKPAISNRAARVGMPPEMTRRALLNYLNTELSNMCAEATKEWGQGIFKALKAKSEINDDNPIVMGKIWSKINGGISTKVDAIMDSGCTHMYLEADVLGGRKMIEAAVILGIDEKLGSHPPIVSL